MNVTEQSARDIALGSLVRRRVLVTGGSGFLGTHLVRRLTGLGVQVVVYDLRPPQPALGLEAVFGDVLDKAALQRAARGCEIVFHLAALVGVERILSMPREVMDTNLQGTVNALEAAEQAGAQRFVFASSSEIYGEGAGALLSEETPPAPVSVYGASKLAAERRCSESARSGRMHVVRVRPFNAYGPGQCENFVVPRFIQRALQGKGPVIYGSGRQIRAYTYVSDIVEGVCLAAAQADGQDRAYNLGSSVATSTADLGRLVLGAAGVVAVPEHRALGDGIRSPEREIFHRLPDPSRAERELGFRARVGLGEGIRLCLQSMKEAAGQVRAAASFAGQEA